MDPVPSDVIASFPPAIDPKAADPPPNDPAEPAAVAEVTENPAVQVPATVDPTASEDPGAISKLFFGFKLDFNFRRETDLALPFFLFLFFLFRGSGASAFGRDTPATPPQLAPLLHDFGVCAGN
jgi:hypothetical protein